MASVIDRLRQLSTAPGRKGGAFDDWLKQDDTLSFLTDNAREGEIVIYASLDHVYLQTVVVPSKELEPLDMDDLQKWELIHDSWSMNYGNKEPVVWLEPPFKHESSKALRSAEKLIFSRSFEGFDIDKHYYELLQKFAHIFGLHYVQHRRAYCSLDENGDVQSVIRIINLPDQAGLRAGTVIVASRRFIDEYLLMSEAIAVRAFDFTRFDKNAFPGWGDNRNEIYREDAEFGCRLTIQPGIGSYMRGVQIVRPLESMAQFYDRLAHADEAKQYVSFIAFDWKNNVVKEISCAPGATANYFTESDLPFEVTPAFFRPEVLQRYKSDPKKYTLEERSIYCRGSWCLKTFDINEEGQVHTYLVYLRQLPYSEQLYWKSFNEPPKDTISKRAFTTDIKGEYHSDYNALQSVVIFIRKLTEGGVAWWKLKADDLPLKVHYPVTEASEEWANEIMALDKLLVEGFEAGWLKAKASELKQKTEASDGSLALTERCLRGLGFDEEQPLRTLHHLRSKLKGHVAGSEANALRQAALDQHGTYRKHFEDLCSCCDKAMRRIGEAFGSTSGNAANERVRRGGR
jgi:hypothetical protein